MGLAVDGAHRHDMKLVQATVDSVPVQRPVPSPEQPQGLCLDKGYDFDEVRQTLHEFGVNVGVTAIPKDGALFGPPAGATAAVWAEVTSSPVPPPSI